MIFRDAKRDNVVADNAAEFLKAVRQSRAQDSFKRRAFTIPELRALLESADPEWQSMIRIGLYSGARLADIAILRWSNVDLARSELRYVAKKTGKSALIPIVGALHCHLTALPSSDDPREFLHPRAAAYVLRGNNSVRLSQEFGALLVQAGLRIERSKGQLIQGQHALYPLSFHSLRHTAVTLLKDAGIPAAVVMELVGHSSAQMSQLYTHVGREALERASAALPSI
jgi:integrase